jgi:hypothetical protein
MRFKPAYVSGLLLIALSGNAFGQASLPWARSEQTKGPEKEEVLESQLPLVRARIEGSIEVWVGQAVPLNIEVVVPSWFTGAPRFPELEVPNAVTLSPEAAVNFVVQSAGETFSAQGRRYLIFPQVKGKYTVPSAKVEVTYAMPDGKPSGPKYLASPSLIFEARVPAGAEGAKYFLTTKNFHIDQFLDRKLEGLKVGDSITRTVNMTAEDTVGMTLPPLSFEAPEGMRLYTGAPKISEKAERGKIEAVRIETATYILEKEGRYKFPEIVILWWNPQKKKMNKARLPAIEFQVGGNAGYSTEVFASSEEIGGKRSDEPRRTVLDRLKASLHWVFVALGLLVFLLIIRRILSTKGISIRSWLAERQRQRAEAEVTYFKRFRKASLSNDARVTLRELMFWLDRLNTQPEASTLERFARETGLPELLKEEGALKAFLFARPAAKGPSEFQAGWSGKAFYKLVARARRAQIRKSKKLKQDREQMLALNSGF